MERYKGQDLGPAPHIAMLFSDKLGGFVVLTPLMRGLKERFPRATMDYFGGERTAELEAGCRFIDWRYSLFGRDDSLAGLPAAIDQRQQAAGLYDLAVNLDLEPTTAFAVPLLNPRYLVGYSIRADGRGPIPEENDARGRLQTDFWSADDLLTRYRGILSTNFIGEIFCRLAYIETDFFRTEVAVADPGIEIPALLIATGGTRSAKLWSSEQWIKLVRLCCAEGWSVGLLGAAPQAQEVYGSLDTEQRMLEATPLIDLRGRLSLPAVAGALQKARACVTVDNGIMHIAYTVGTPTVALFGASPWQLWTPPVGNLYLVLPAEPCNLCHENRYRNADCLLPVHQCMNSVTPETVFARLKQVIRPSLPAKAGE